MTKLFADYSRLSDKEKKQYEGMLKQMYTLLGIATVLFYVLPYLFKFLGGLGSILLYLTIANVYTVFSFIAGLLNSKKYGFNLVVPLGLAIFFLPSVMILYGDLRFAALSPALFIIGLFGELTGYLWVKRKKNKRQPIGLNSLINGRPEKKRKKQNSGNCNQKKEVKLRKK